MAEKNPFEGYAVKVTDEEKNPFAGRAVRKDEEEKYSALERGAGFVTDNVSKGLQKLGNVVPSLVNLGNAAGFYGYNKPLPDMPMVGDKLREQTKALGLSDVPEFQPEGTAQELLALGIQGAASSPGGPLSMASGALGEIGAKYGRDIGGTAGEIVGGIGGAMAGGSAARQTSRLMNMGKPTGKPVYDAMIAEGVKPRVLGDATTDTLHRPSTTQQVTSFMGQVPILGRPITKAVDDTIAEIAQAKQRLQGQIGAGTTDNIAFGQHVQRGIQQSLDNFRSTAEQSYDMLRTSTQPTDLFPWQNTKSALDKFTDSKIAGGQASSEAFSSDFIQRMKAAVEQDFPNGMSYQALDDMRKEVGKRLKSGPGISDADQGELKALYGALTQDMRNVAQARGFDAEFDVVNNWYNTTRETLNQQAKMLDMYADKVYQTTMAGVKEGGTNLVNLKASLGPNNWPYVRSSVLERMGMVPDSAGAQHFDINKFFNDYKNMNPDARGVLFPEPEYRQSLDNLATISEAMQTTARAGNSSRTAASLTMLEQIGRGAMLAPAAITGAVSFGASAAALAPAAAQYGISKMLAWPALTKWLATPVAQFGGVDKALHQLNKLTAAQPEMADDVIEFLESNRDAFEQPSETERAFGGLR